MKINKITRSFYYKYNSGNYETRDFGCSQEVELEESDNPERISELVHEFCKSSVLKSVNEYIKEIKGEETKSESVDLPVK
jgi:hypothetical protein